MIVIEPIL